MRPFILCVLQSCVSTEHKEFLDNPKMVLDVVYKTMVMEGFVPK